MTCDHRILTGTFDDGSQLLVERSADDNTVTYTAATRPNSHPHTRWSTPIKLQTEDD